MSNTKWRISGGIGVPAPPEEDGQVMLQGVGFPLRPIDGVPPVGTGDIFEGLPVAEGLFTQWMGPYQSGQIYPVGAIVRDGDWLMVSNTTTLSKPAPVPDGNPTWSMADTPSFLTESNESVIYSGHTYTFLESGWVKGLRVWVTELSVNTNYRIIIVDSTDPNAIKTRVIDDPLLTEGAWKIVSLVDELVAAGTIWTVYVDALNTGSDTVVTGGWTYNGAENTAAPPLSGWNHRAQQDLVRISTTDLDSTDRTSELLGMIPGTTILFAETGAPELSFTYRVIGEVAGFTGYVEVPVELATIGGGGSPTAGKTTSMTATVPIALPTEYAELAGGVPTPAWATVVGFLEFDGVDQGGGANGYGVDLNFEPAVINPLWDVVSISG